MTRVTALEEPAIKKFSPRLPVAFSLQKPCWGSLAPFPATSCRSPSPCQEVLPVLWAEFSCQGLSGASLGLGIPLPSKRGAGRSGTTWVQLGAGHHSAHPASCLPCCPKECGWDLAIW